MDQQIVIARYAEDVAWAEKLPAIVYNKGGPLESSLELRPLPNVGREGHTFLTHIVDHWDELADRTLFTQGALDHLPQGITLERFLAVPEEVVVPRAMRLREWDANGRILHLSPWKDYLLNGKMARARLSMPEWFDTYIGVNILAQGSVFYSPGAMINVKRECIHRRGRDFYRRVLETVAYHINPEEGHYLERAWLYCFSTPATQVAFLTQ